MYTDKYLEEFEAVYWDAYFAAKWEVSQYWRDQIELAEEELNGGDLLKYLETISNLRQIAVRNKDGDAGDMPVPVGDGDQAMTPSKTKEVRGGIDFNSANFNLQIKRDGRGVPLPLALQDMAQLSRIRGFIPEVIAIKPVVDLPILGELQQTLLTFDRK